MSDLSPEGARLAAELRGLRAKSGLSLAALAEESGYSKSSWQRYLSGKALPPWLAVRALCVLAGSPEPRLQALWELAEAAWRGRDVVEPAPAAVTESVALGEPAAAGAGTGAGTGIAPGTAHGTAAGTTPGTAVSAAMAVAEAEASEVVDILENRAAPRRKAASSKTGAAAKRPGRPRLWWALGLTVLSAALVAAVVLKEPANRPAAKTTPGFHVGCTGPACSGQDPQVTLCGVEPQTLLDQQTPEGAGIEIRYNPLCRAVWARTWNTKLGDTLVLNDAGGEAESVIISQPQDLNQFMYTPLLGLPGGHGDTLRVCLKKGPAGASQCYATETP